MENNLLKAYAEVDKILSFMEISYVEKVPKKLREIFKNEKLKDYNPNINKNIPLNEQNLERKTYAILAMLDLNYWCNNEEEKQELLQAYSNNDTKRQEKLREKYNSNNILKNRTKEQEKITEEDLKDILESGEFAKEDKSILIDFCNSFQQKFSTFVDKDEFLNRISTLKRMQYEHRGDKADASYSQNGTLAINDDLHGNKRKAIIYHELMHLISMHVPRENPEFGRVQGFKIGSVDINEIMTEYLTTRLLLHERIEDLKGKYNITNENGIEEYVEHDGTGYIKVAKLGEMYHKIFGQEIVDGYFNNAIKFQEMFNERYKFLDDGEFTPMENAVELGGNIYRNYANALRIFMANENEKLNSGNLSVYEYLKESKPIRDCLPVRKDTRLEECKIAGIPSGVEKFLMRLDEKFVAQFIRPDVVSKSQDVNTLRKKKDFFIALNAIRDNIEHLSPEDLENIDMNFQYNSNSRNMNISVNGIEIQVFTDGETYLGTNEIERKYEQNFDINALSDRIITTTQITTDTINAGTGIEETNAVIIEIKRTQTRDKQQGIDK